MVQLLLQYHKHENTFNISAFVYPLLVKKAVGKVKQSSLAWILKIPCLSPHWKTLNIIRMLLKRKSVALFWDILIGILGNVSHVLESWGSKAWDTWQNWYSFLMIINGPHTSDRIPSFCCVEAFSTYIDTPSLTQTWDLHKDRHVTSRVLSCSDIVKHRLELVTVNLQERRAVINSILTHQILKRIAVDLMNPTGHLPMWLRELLIIEIIEEKNGRRPDVP